MDLRFEWDRRKATINEAKHRVAFEEALAVFSDPLARIFDDPDHSHAEARELIIGHSKTQRLLVVSFAERAALSGFSVLARSRDGSARTMKRNARREHREDGNEMRPEYHFDYGKARPNRFAGRIQAGAVAVVLDPDVASVFRSAGKVNALLRSVISAMPERRRKRTKAG